MTEEHSAITYNKLAGRYADKPELQVKSAFLPFASVEKFILPSSIYNSDNADRPTAIMTVRAILIALPILIVFLAAIICIETSWFDSSGKASVVPAVSLSVLAFAVTLYLIRIDRLKLAMVVLTLCGTVIITGLVFVNGGISKSAATPLLVVLPVTYFCLINTRTGIWSTFLVPFVVILVEFTLAQTGQSLPDLSSQGSTAFNSSIANFVAYVLVCVVVYSLVRTINLLQSELELERALLVDLASRDPLTGLFNRRAFYTQLNQMHESSLKNGCFLAVFIVDLNDFKPVNDKYGHQVGDALLKEIAKRLSILNIGNMCVARLGGDEFALATDAVTNNIAAAHIAVSISDTIKCPAHIEGHSINISASVGYSIHSKSNDNLSNILNKADANMYAQKNASRPVRSDAQLAG